MAGPVWARWFGVIAYRAVQTQRARRHLGPFSIPVIRLGPGRHEGPQQIPLPGSWRLALSVRTSAMAKRRLWQYR